MFDPKHLLHSTLGAILPETNMISRQEFDAQSALLAKTEHQLESLQAELKVLSNKITLLEQAKK